MCVRESVMKTHKQTLEPSLIRCVHRLFSAGVSTAAGGALGPSQPEVSAQGECALRGQAVAASDASALHVVGGDACGHELVLHVAWPRPVGMQTHFPHPRSRG